MYKNIFKYDEMKRSEHMAVRETVGWYLWTHQLMQVEGDDAEAFLDYMFPNSISKLGIGRDRYTVMLDAQGEIIDDVVVMRFEDHFWVSTLFPSYMDDWFYEHQGSFDVDFYEVTDEWHMFAIQGPRSADVLTELCDAPVEGMRFFQHAPNSIGGIDVIVNRAGFTGEKLGYEVYCPAEQTDDIEDAIARCAEKHGGRKVTEFQVMAWTLPTEAGFYYMRDLRHTNPFEVGLDSNIDWEKEFVGKAALEKIREEGPAREMLGFTVEDDSPFIQAKQYGGPGEAVYLNGEEVGRVSKMVYSYVKDINCGYILAKKGYLKIGDRIGIHGSEAVICEKKWMQ
ncbi:MAG: aminomethyltransferase family protein [Eggerthellaceae bacterium]|nr:aminomethyltransferase family protein [Eggerthellaceae bacterium]